LLENFQPPPETKHLILFGDNDASGVGQRAAYALASRLAPKMRVDVKTPDEPNTDWNDVLRATAGGC
jgi:putative DNA primase/helicase